LSKILDLLNYNRWDKKSDAACKGRAEEHSGHITPQDFDADTREKLANTYIFNPIEKPVERSKEDKPRPERKIAYHKHKPVTAESRSINLIPWLISFLAVLLLLVNIAFRGKIVVKIDIINDAEPKPVARIIEDSPAKEDIVPIVEAYQPAGQAIKPRSIILTGAGLPNKDIVKRVGFYGAALNKSKLLDGGFLLFNDGTAGYASTGFDLSYPMDLSVSTLDFFVKGAYGNESLKLFLRDANSKSYLPQATKLLFKNNMSKDWQFVSVPLKGFSGSYNPQVINHIGFEFGTQTTQNEPGTSIYIKNIKIVDNSPVSR